MSTHQHRTGVPTSRRRRLPDLHPTQVPSSKCPHCGHLHHFADVDATDADRKTRPLGHGAAIVCLGCAQVLMLGNNLVLDEVADRAFIDSAPVRAERWRVVEAQNLKPPDDLVEATARAEGRPLPDPEPTVSPLNVLHVWPTESGLDYPYAVSHGALTTVELIVTGDLMYGAEMLFRLVVSSWPQLEDSVKVGDRFTYDTLLDYELALAPVPADLAGDIGLPGGVTYLQLVVQDDDGYWPFDPEGLHAPMLAGPDWRPSPAEVFVLDVDQLV